MLPDIKISVIITTHDRPDKVKRAILSLAQQLRLPDEVIIVDDGSELPYDKTVLQLFPPSVRVLPLSLAPAHGVSAARNYGVAQSRSAYICFLDDDDVFCTNKLQELVLELVKNDFPDVIFHAADIVFPNEGLSYTSAKPALTHLSHDILLYNILGSASRIACRREFFRRVGGFDETIKASEDWELWIRLICNGARVTYIDKSLIRYECMTRNGSLSKGEDNNKHGRQCIYRKYASTYAEMSESDHYLCQQYDEKDRFWRFIVNYQQRSALQSAWRLFCMNKNFSSALLLILTLWGPRAVLRARSLR